LEDDLKKDAIVLGSILTTLFSLFTMLAFASPESGKTPHRVPRVNSQIHVDAILNEEVWQRALVMEVKYEVRPGENIPAPVRTEVLLAYSESHLYAAFRAYDPDASQIRARIADRDNLWSDDWVVLILDTFNDERRTYDFFCNPLGVQGDEIESPQGEEPAWDAIWDSAGRITREGYVVEMAIPFSSFRFQRTDGDQIWGFDAVRSYPRSVRHHLGLFPRDRNNNCYLCQAEKLIGFAGATPGRNIEIDPTLSGLVTQEREGVTEGPFEERDRHLDPGISASWGFTPNLTVNATINPDFSQVEADAAQLDINTQFALFYPEKRPFFLEASDYFDTRLSAVHTRTLADPEWGLKVTGREGANIIGLFVVRDEITNLLFPASQGSRSTSLQMNSTGAVARYRRDVGTSSSLGVLLTDRDGEDYYNRLAGFDGNIRVTPRDRLRFQVLGSRTRYPEEVSSDFDQPHDFFEGTAFDVYYSHDTRSLDWYGIYRQISPDFRADLGFMTQADFRYIDIGWGHTWNNDPDHWWNMLNFGSGYEYEDDFQGGILHRGVTFWFNYAGLIQSWIDVYGQAGRETFNGTEFDNSYLNVEGGIRPSGALYLQIETAFGNQIDYANTRQGRWISLEPYIECKLGRHLTLELDHIFERLDIDEGRLYTANISQLKLVYQFTKRAFLRTILQYVYYDYNVELYTFPIDPEYKSFFSQTLFSYKINPQTVLFLGYSDNYFGDQDLSLRQTDRTFFAKIGYAWVL
jgi:hypothetical protein